MKTFEIITREKSNIPRFKWGSQMTYFTKARTGKSALNKLIKKSSDFRNLMNTDEFQITIRK